MTSLHHDATESTNVSVNGQNSPVELDADITEDGFSEDEWSGEEKEWSPEQQAEMEAWWRETGNAQAVLPAEIILDPDLSHAVIHLLLFMSLWARGQWLGISPYKLAQRMHVSHQACSKLMERARQQGLLHRVTSPKGRTYWRMRWLTPFRRQDVPTTQPQVAHTTQPQVAQQPQVASPRTHARTRSTSSSLSTSSSTKSSTPSLTDEERAWLHKRWDSRLGVVWVDEQIEMCLGYKTTKNHKNIKLACNQWLMKSETEVNNARAAKARAEKAASPYVRAAAPEPPPLQTNPPPPRSPHTQAIIEWETDHPGEWPRTPTKEEIRPYLPKELQ